MFRRSARLACMVILTLVALLGTGTSAAFAAAPGTMSLADLQAKLAATDTPVAGYFRTVVKGSSIATFPLEILSVTGGADPSETLILFESTSTVAAYGGIVSGMSGSPVYVDDLIVGAVSYGDAFALRGTGLATPIEAMLDIKQRFVSVQELPLPVLTSSGPIGSVIVTPDPGSYASLSAAGTLVAQPLATPMYIGGVSPADKIYQRIAEKMRKRGYDVTPTYGMLGGGGLSAQSAAETFSPGSAIAVMGARGDLWYGGIGTVTYVDGNDVYAFGHPAWKDGDTAMFMSNATIDGVWPSTNLPYKLGRPGAVAGTITQDRTAGVLGVFGSYPQETTVTATARRVKGSVTETETRSTVVLSRRMANSIYGVPELVAFGAYPAGSRLFDSQFEPGSARTTTTAQVYDPSSGKSFEVTMTNTVDTAQDISLSVLDDAAMIVERMMGIAVYGAQSPVITRLDLTSEMSASRASSEILDAGLPDGPKPGDNRVRLVMRDYGTHTTYTVDATLTLPASATDSDGSLIVGSSRDVVELFSPDEPDDSQTTASDIPTIAATVAELNALAPLDRITIAYRQFDSSGAADDSPVATASVTAHGPVRGLVMKDVTRLTARPAASTVSYGGATVIRGTLRGVSAGALRVFITPAGEPERELSDGAVAFISDGEWPEYSVSVRGLRKNSSVRVVYEGNTKSTACETAATVKVRARVGLASKSRVRRSTMVSLSASVLPTTTAGSRVRFERYDRTRRRWVPVHASATKVLGSTARASVRIKVNTETRVRAVFLPARAATNVGATSTTRTIRVY